MIDCRWNFPSVSLNLVIFTSAVAISCASDVRGVADGEIGARGAPIIGGAPGGPDGIGHVFVASDPIDYCTATLVAPDLVLTAKHCVYVDENPNGALVIDQQIVKFSPSSSNDSSKWTDAIPVTKVMVAPRQTLPVNDGKRSFMAGFTSDVAVYRLATPITGVAPLLLARELPTLAKPIFATAGFGFTTHRGIDPTVRMTGQLTLAMNGGSYLQARFPTYPQYESAVLALSPNEPRADLMDEWQYETLLQDYEMVFDGPNDIQICSGDSGAPLLQKDAGGNWRVFGVASGSKHYVASRCYWGSVFSTFGPTTLAFLDSLGITMAVDAGKGGVGGSGGVDGGGDGSTAGAGGGGGAPGIGGRAGAGGAGIAGAAGTGGDHVDAGADDVDAAGSHGGAAGMTGPDAAGAAGGAVAAGPSGSTDTRSSGCSCALASREPAPFGRAVLPLLFVAVLRRRRNGTRCKRREFLFSK